MIHRTARRSIALKSEDAALFETLGLHSWTTLGLLSVPLTSEFISFAAADAMRRWYGRALDLWLARTETPSRLVLERSGVKLRDYGDEGNRPDPPFLFGVARIDRGFNSWVQPS